MLDWLSRTNIKVWRVKPTLLIATSPGVRGGATVLQAAVNYFPFLSAKDVADFSLPNFYDNFSEEDNSNDELHEELIRKIQLFNRHLNN